MFRFIGIGLAPALHDSAVRWPTCVRLDKILRRTPVQTQYNIIVLLNYNNNWVGYKDLRFERHCRNIEMHLPEGIIFCKTVTVIVDYAYRIPMISCKSKL